MLRRLIDLVAGTGEGLGPEAVTEDPNLATAALLVEAALMDERFAESERQQIAALLQTRFGLGEAEADALIDKAMEQVQGANQLFGFTRTVNEHFEHEDRVALMEMLWQVAYADGELDHYEANLMRRIAGLIHVSDRESGAARKRALTSLGMGASPGLGD